MCGWNRHAKGRTNGTVLARVAFERCMPLSSRPEDAVERHREPSPGVVAASGSVLLGELGVAPLRGISGHCLGKLYGQFGDTEGPTITKLEELFREATTGFPFSLVAFLSTDDPKVPAGPDDRKLVTLADFFAYMDEDVELWNKRYSWEQSAGRQWQHYLDDLSAFFAFLDKTEILATQMAREQGIVR